MINLCFVTDDGYSMPTGVTIYSIYKNRNKKNKYTLYILCKNVSEDNKKKFIKLSHDDFKVILIDCDDKDFSDLYIPGIPATPTSIYKFYIPELLNNVNKVLYLDGDIIVTKDLKELYNLELNDNYIGAVTDSIGLSNKKYLDGNYSYINSGVMLMNLDLMRKDNLSSKLLDYRRNGFNKFMDQDAFNFVLKNKIEILPFKYNTQLNVISTSIITNQKNTLKKIKNYWNITDNIISYNNILNNSVILHYTRTKPWKFYDGVGNDLWLYYYLNSQYGNTPIIRDSYHMKKLSTTKTYKFSIALSSFKNNIIKCFKKIKKDKYEIFLKQFYIKK